MNEKFNNQNGNTSEEGQAGSDSSQSSCGPSCECTNGKRLSNRTKVIICLVIILAAGAVLMRTIIRKADTKVVDNKEAYVSVPEQNLPQEKETDLRNDTFSSVKKTAETDKTESKASELTHTKESFWKEPLTSLSSLNTVAASNDAVFVLLSEGDMEGSISEISKIEAAAKTIISRGVNIAAFSLKKDAPEFSNLAKQLSGSGVLVMVKGVGMSGVSSSDLTEEKLIQAYVTASQPHSGCGPTCGPSDCK